MKNPIKNLILTVGLAVGAAGCASAPARFYTLNSTVTGWATPPANCSVVVGPVTIPRLVDRPQFTVQAAPNRVTMDEFNRWAEPLNDNIAHVVADNLAALLGEPRVTVGTLPHIDPAYRVTINIQKFESVPGIMAEIEAAWVVRKSADGTTTMGVFQASEPVADGSYDALAAAHSRGLAKVSSHIAAAIRTAAANGGK